MHACAVILYIISEELINTGVGRAAQRDIDLVDAVAYCAYQALDNIDGAAALLTVAERRPRRRPAPAASAAAQWQ